MWPAGSPTDTVSFSNLQTEQEIPTFAASVQVASITPSTKSCFPVAGITSSVVAAQTLQVFVPLPASAHVAALSTTNSPHLCPSTIAL